VSTCVCEEFGWACVCNGAFVCVENVVGGARACLSVFVCVFV